MAPTMRPIFRCSTNRSSAVLKFRHVDHVGAAGAVERSRGARNVRHRCLNRLAAHRAIDELTDLGCRSLAARKWRIDQTVPLLQLNPVRHWCLLYSPGGGRTAPWSLALDHDR